MNLADEIFRRRFPAEEKLSSYGFEKKGDAWLFVNPVHEGQFTLEVCVRNKRTSARLIDNDFHDEFIQIDIKDAVGDFLGKLREECEGILTDIREKCFYKEDYLFPQSNRIDSQIKDIYGVYPEFLWEDTPGCGVYRDRDSEKWFGIIMNVSRKKVAGDKDEEIEVMNLKLDENVPEYLTHTGVYPAYHMNKKHWVSVILDDTLSDEEVMGMIGMSHQKISKKEERRKR